MIRKSVKIKFQIPHQPAHWLLWLIKGWRIESSMKNTASISTFASRLKKNASICKVNTNASILINYQYFVCLQLLILLLCPLQKSQLSVTFFINRVFHDPRFQVRTSGNVVFRWRGKIVKSNYHYFVYLQLLFLTKVTVDCYIFITRSLHDPRFQV